MTAGHVSRDDLIAGVEEGLLVTELIGSSVNLITGDYSRGAAGFGLKMAKLPIRLPKRLLPGISTIC